jgi:hypothetical protein
MRAKNRHPFVFPGTDRFAVRRRLGEGGMGAVYEAYDRERDQCVALKTILRLDATSLYRFKKEFRTLADVSHPNLVRLYELISDGDQWFFTMELIDGVDFLRFVCPEELLPDDDPLGDTLSTTQNIFLGSPGTAEAGTDPATPEGSTEASSGGRKGAEGAAPPSTEVETAGRSSAKTGDTATDRTPPAGNGAGPVAPREIPPPHPVRLRAALRQLAEVLNALHARGILHRDVKASNVLVTRRGRVVLMDFGLSKVLTQDDGGETTAGRVVGTASYMAPEQAAGKPLTPASDWYSVGVLLYRALTGRLPHSGARFDVMIAKQTADPTPPGELNPRAPGDLCALCQGLLRRDPEARPTGEEVLRRLGAAPALGGAGPSKPEAGGRSFVGRGEHLAALREAAEAVEGGRPTALFLHGQSGVGKSTLLQHFLDELTARGRAIVLAGRCYEQESVAYKAMDSLIDALSQYLRRLPPLEAEALLPRDTAALARVFPVLRRVDAVANAPIRGREALDARELRRRAFAALRELLARIGDRKLLVLYIDDLHWGDLDSAALLSELTRPPDAPILLLLCAFRSEHAEASPCLREMLRPGPAGSPQADRRVLEVGPLTPEECHDLALGTFGADDPLAELKAQTIVREANGSPYLAVELARYLSATPDEDAESSSFEITLDQVLSRRIDRLPAAARALLEAVAVAGRPVRQSVACRASGLEADGYAALGLLRNEHLIRTAGPGALDDVETYHDRIRVAVVGQLPDEARVALHRALAAELEAAGRADPETLAVHLEAAGEPDRAGLYYAEAAEAAAEALAFERAAMLYRRALELRPPGEARELKARLGDALANAGRGYESARAYQEAAAESDEAAALVLRRNAAYQFLISGHIDEGLSAFNAILERVGMPLPSTPGQALARLLLSRTLLRLRGLGFRERDASAVDPRELERIDIARSVAVGISVVDVIRGSDYQTRSLLLALRAGEPSRVALSLGWEAVHSACSGVPARRRTARRIEMADAIARRIDDPRAIGMTALSAGAAGYLEGRFAAGLASIDRAIEVFRGRCTGVVWELDTAQMFGLWNLIELGLYGELRRRFVLVYKEAGERGDRYLQSTLGSCVGVHALLATDEVDRARGQMEEAIGGWSQRGFHVQHLNYFYGSLAIHLYAGDGPSAWRLAAETLPRLKASMLSRVQSIRIDVQNHAARSALATAAGSSEPAPLLAEAERCARRIEREGTVRSAPLARLVRAGACRVRDDLDGSVRLLRQAVDGFDAAAMGLYAACARRQLGRLVGGDEGRELLARADAAMAAQSIANPERVTALYAPGFPGPA